MLGPTQCSMAISFFSTQKIARKYYMIFLIVRFLEGGRHQLQTGARGARGSQKRKSL